MIRTHEAGTLRAQDIGQTVTLAGWIGRRRAHAGVAFLDLRDASGIVQVVVPDPQVVDAALQCTDGEPAVEVRTGPRLAIDEHTRPGARLRLA